MIKNIAAIETAFGLKAGDFKAMYDSPEEKEIDLTTLAIVPKADYEVMKKSDFNTRLENAKIAAEEIQIKEMKRIAGIDVSGKTPAIFMDAYKAKVLAEGNLNPDARVVELEKNFNGMKTNFDNATLELTTLKKNYTQKDNERKVNDLIMSAISEKVILPKEDLVTIFKTKITPEVNDAGVVIFKKDGEIMKNTTTMSPKTITEIMPDFITPYAKAPDGGGGGHDTPGQAKPGGYEVFVKEMKDAGKEEGSKPFVDELKIRMAAKTLTI